MQSFGMNLDSEFRNWDGKSTARLRQIANNVSSADYDEILRIVRAEDETAARAASWVMKTLIEDGAKIIPPWDVLAGQPHWEIVLHTLQSVQHVPADFPSEILHPYLDHDRPMLRAWSLDALVRLGDSGAAYWLGKALSDPKASVRARAKQLMIVHRP